MRRPLGIRGAVDLTAPDSADTARERPQTVGEALDDLGFGTANRGMVCRLFGLDPAEPLDGPVVVLHLGQVVIVVDDVDLDDGNRPVASGPIVASGPEVQVAAAPHSSAVTEGQPQ